MVESRDVLAEEIADALGLSPQMVRFYAARLAIEITIGRPTKKEEWSRIFSAVGYSGRPIEEGGRRRARARGVLDE